MIQVIIFSFDRAMQLSLLLESIVKYDINKYLNVNILFGYSSEEYKKSYLQLKNRYPDFLWVEEIFFSKETDSHNYYDNRYDSFDLSYWHNIYLWLKNKKLRNRRSNFKSAILQILSRSKDEFVMFLTDDSLFYRKIQILQSDLQKLRKSPLGYSFSLRHGAHQEGGLYDELSDTIQWNVYHNDLSTDWGYPFSVDGHIYDKNVIQRIIKRILFNNPNTMEGNIAYFIIERKYFSQIVAMKQSCLVGFELNRVQTVSANHHLNISQEKLNRYFLDGYSLSIDFDEMNVKRFRPEITDLNVHKDDEKITLL